MQIYNKTTDTTHPPIQRNPPATPVLTPTLHKVKLAVHSFTQTYKYTKLNSTLQKISIFHCYTITFAYICHINHLFNTLPIIYMFTLKNHFSKIPSQSTTISFLKEIDTNIYISANYLLEGDTTPGSMSKFNYTTHTFGFAIGNIAHATDITSHTIGISIRTINNIDHTIDIFAQAINNIAHTIDIFAHTINNISHAIGNISHTINNIDHTIDIFARTIGNVSHTIGNINKPQTDSTSTTPCSLVITII